MDNLTHSLVGALAADLVLSIRRRAGARIEKHVATTLVLGSIIANNLPDLDLILTPLTGGKLGYLLHHRGHTHTLVLAPLMAALILGTVAAISKWRRWALSQAEWFCLIGLTLLGQVLHLSCDWLNNYGVHPFWPWNSQWFYLDSVFIVEPWLWLSLIPAIATRSLTWPSTVTGLLLIAAVPVLAVSSGLVPTAIIVAFTTFGVALLALSRFYPRARLPLACVSLATVLAVFISTSRLVFRDLKSEYERSFPGSTLLDVVRAPLPANPFCWSFIALSLESSELYVSRSGTWAPWPEVMNAASCPEARTQDAFESQVNAPESAALAWHGETSDSRASLRKLNEHHCGAAAFFRFARAPKLEVAGDSWILKDLRYAAVLGDASFAAMTIAKTAQECPRHVPPWVPPRQDLLQMRSN